VRTASLEHPRRPPVAAAYNQFAADHKAYRPIFTGQFTVTASAFDELLSEKIGRCFSKLPLDVRASFLYTVDSTVDHVQRRHLLRMMTTSIPPAFTF